MSYSQEQKQKALEMLDTDKIADVESKTGISRTTLTRWKKQWEQAKQIEAESENKKQTEEQEKTSDNPQTENTKMKKQNIGRLEESLDKEPRNWLPLASRLLNHYINFRRFEDARALIEKAYTIYPNNVYIKNSEAKLENRLRNFSQAKEIAEETLKRRPNDTYAINCLVASYIGMGQLDEAEKIILEKKDKMNIKTRNVMYNRLARIYTHKRDTIKLASIISEFKEMCSQEEFRSFMQSGLVDLEILKGNFEKANEYAQQAADAVAKTYCFMNIGMYGQAQKAFEEIDLDTISDVERYGLEARLHALQGRRQEAEKCIEECKLVASIEDHYPEHYGLEVDRINHIYSLIQHSKQLSGESKTNKELQALYQIAKEEKDDKVLSLLRINGISFEENVAEASTNDLLAELYVSSLYIENLKKQVDIAKQKGNMEQFQSLCKELLRVDPNNIRARERLLLCAMEQPNSEEGTRLTEEILGIDPENLLALQYKMLSKAQEGKSKEAKRLASTLLEQDYLNVTARKCLLDIAMVEGNQEEAFELQRDILILEPRNSKLRSQLLQEAMKRRDIPLLKMLLEEEKFYGGEEQPIIKEESKKTEEVRHGQDEVKANVQSRLERVMHIFDGATWTPPAMEERKMKKVSLAEIGTLKRKFYSQVDEQSAIEIGKEILEQNPFDASVRTATIKKLMNAKEYEQAEKLCLDGVVYNNQDYGFISKMFLFAKGKGSREQMMYWGKKKMEIDPAAMSSWVSAFEIAKDGTDVKREIAEHILTLENYRDCESYTQKMRQMAKNYLESKRKPEEQESR